jgi:hypothetical protein
MSGGPDVSRAPFAYLRAVFVISCDQFLQNVVFAEREKQVPKKEEVHENASNRRDGDRTRRAVFRPLQLALQPWAAVAPPRPSKAAMRP